MGENPATTAVDSFGRVREVRGLHVADASLFGGAVGVNPQGTVMALCRRNVLRFLHGG
jgi:choline dehydrogenase-like flavoprotein